MKIITGTDRIVLLIPFLGIVFKFPKIKLKEAFRGIIYYRKKQPKFFKRWIFGSIESSIWATFGCLLFKGIFCNLIEIYFYQRRRYPIIAPTYFSFFGLLNIQRYSESILENQQSFLIEIPRIVGTDAFRMHHLNSPDNYGKIGNKIVFVDCGNRQLLSVLNNYHNELQILFNKEAQDK